MFNFVVKFGFTNSLNNPGFLYKSKGFFIELSISFRLWWWINKHFFSISIYLSLGCLLLHRLKSVESQIIYSLYASNSVKIY